MNLYHRIVYRIHQTRIPFPRNEKEGIIGEFFYHFPFIQ